jgi:ABC-2 type transport system permease protein
LVVDVFPRACSTNLLTQQPVGTDIWIALAWCVGILIVAYNFAIATYRRKIS